MLLVAAACAPTRRRTPDDTIVMAIETPMTTADPRYALTNYDGKLAKLVAPGLTTVDTPDASAQLNLAAHIDVIDPLTVDVTLRPDARFSDGSPVTADDVARTYLSVLGRCTCDDPDSECHSLYQKGFAERYKDIEVVAPDRVRFHLVAPLGTLMSDLEFGIVSFHGAPPGKCHDRGPVIGAGPYVLAHLTPYAAYLDANPHARDVPRTPHVEIRFVSYDAARLVMLVGGSLDLLQNAARPDLVDEISHRPRLAVHAAPSVLLSYMLINTEDSVLRDVRVREAIALALDRPALIAAELGGRAQLATGLLPPTHWAYNGDVPHWNRDLPRARKLLDEAGFPPGRGGERLHLVYKTSADAFRVALAHLIAAQLGEVGISVEVRPFEFATFFVDIKSGNYQIATMQTSEITEPDFYYFYFHSSRIPSKRDPDGGNRWRYRNPELDRLVEAGRREVDPARRKPLYAQAQLLVARDLPIIPLWHEDNVVLANVDLDGYDIVPDARFIGLVGAYKRH